MISPVAILTDPLQRLYEYHETHEKLLKRYSLKMGDFFEDYIDKNLKGTAVEIIDIIDEHIALIYISQKKLYTFMNRKGLKM